MNKQWIEDCHGVGNDWRTCAIDFDVAYYLDILGLFETDWMMFEFDDQDHESYYGYPVKKRSTYR